jgi:hypothetical protein
MAIITNIYTALKLLLSSKDVFRGWNENKKITTYSVNEELSLFFSVTVGGFQKVFIQSYR